MSEPLLLASAMEPWDELRARMAAVAAEASCGGDPARACAEPREDCPHSVHQFCLARLLRSEKEGLEADVRDRLERAKQDAEDLLYPRRRREELSIGVRVEPTLLDTPALSELKLNSDHRLIVLTGQPGIGKSVAAAWWGWQRRALWWSAIKLCWFQFWDPSAWRLTQSSALVLDGLDRDWAGAPGVHQRNLKYVLNTRYEEWLPTLVTTNATEDEWYRMAGDRWRSARQSDFAFLPCSGPNLRDPENLRVAYLERMQVPTEAPAPSDDNPF